MNPNDDKIRELFDKLEKIASKELELRRDISAFKEELMALRYAKSNFEPTASDPLKTKAATEEPPQKKEGREEVPPHLAAQRAGTYQENYQPNQQPNQQAEQNKREEAAQNASQSASQGANQSAAQTAKPIFNFEKFLGENLLNKIGILITVIGVLIGVKYSIDNDLISPLTRIILAYAFGAGLLGVGFWLKEKYAAFSAVLVSGSMAVLYITTFIAYDFYELLPQSFTFFLMLLFTAFTVLAALRYDLAVIAHLGLVGAYAIPFLLSDGSGKVHILFSYMALLNVGILIVSLFKNWKSLYYSAFLFTWLIFSGWLVGKYEYEKHFSLAFVFGLAYFFIFYLTLLAYKVRKAEMFGRLEVVMLLLNAFIYFGIGFYTIQSHPQGNELLGIFTLTHALLHFFVGVFLYKKELADKSLLYLVLGLVFVFITLTIPIQLDGSWVTMLWAAEAALLFWIGRSKKIVLYEQISYAVMWLAFFSIWQDWTFGIYDRYSFAETLENKMTPIFNAYFITAALFLVAFGWILWVRAKTASDASQQGILSLHFLSYSAPIIFLIVSYFTFFVEISLYFRQNYLESAFKIVDEIGTTYYNYDESIPKFSYIWLVNYTLLFACLLALLNWKRLKNTILAYLSALLGLTAGLVFLVGSLYFFSELLEQYLFESGQPTKESIFLSDASYIWIRYLSLPFMLGTLWLFFKKVRSSLFQFDLRKLYDAPLHIALVWLLSSELIYIMNYNGMQDSYKLGLSILWGCYALLIIGLGIWKNKKHLRLAAIGFFVLTIAKLFFYDLSQLTNIAKVVVLVILGLLLLVASFLYNKYKNFISDEK
ncbi:DUF2339 domain-containing protein [Hugenholtzia roseola]|uniref:DUF2339 domain-containing protein n=1 Tax=Hugenholtzia roseola TaxID=1002 RepID=UPI00041990CA|nr:DUF2339 domain-containing protein [Hugenholtzia roseola]